MTAIIIKNGKVYHDFENAPFWWSEVYDRVAPGHLVWFGWGWGLVNPRMRFDILHPRDYDDNMRLCPKCRRPLVFCTCDPMYDHDAEVADLDETYAYFEMGRAQKPHP